MSQFESVGVIAGHITAVAGNDKRDAGQLAHQPCQRRPGNDKMTMDNVVLFISAQLEGFEKGPGQISRHFMRVTNIGPFPYGWRPVDINSVDNFK